MQKTKRNKTSENRELNMVLNFDEITGQNTKEHNPNWNQILHDPHKILIVHSSGSGETIRTDSTTQIN